MIGKCKDIIAEGQRLIPIELICGTDDEITQDEIDFLIQMPDNKMFTGCKKGQRNAKSEYWKGNAKHAIKLNMASIQICSISRKNLR